MDATTRFFKSPDSVGVRYELLYQLFEQIDKLDQQSIYQCVKRKECPGYLQYHWEQLLQNKWIHDNYGYSPKYGWRDSYEQTTTTQRIYSRTLGWYNETQTPLMQIMLEELEERGALPVEGSYDAKELVEQMYYLHRQGKDCTHLLDPLIYSVLGRIA